MTRRTSTLVASIVVLVISLGLVTAFPVPFVSFSPGPVKDTLGTTKNKPVISAVFCCSTSSALWSGG